VAHTNQLGSITYEAETTGAFNPATGTGWGENVNTYTTLQIANLMPVDTSGLVHNKTTSDFTEQYRGAGHAYVLMTMGGSFKTIHHLHGHGSTLVGSPSITADETFLGRVFGNVGLSAAASTTLTGGTVTAPTTTASGTFSAGGLCRVGTLGDGDGDGQMYPLLSHVTTTLNLLAGLRGAPVNGAVLYPVVQLYTPSSPTTSALNGTRFEIMTANTQYRCHGCFPMSISITGLSPGEAPRLEVTWGVSWWTDTGSTTFPTTVTQNRNLPAPVAAGSLHVQAVGTTTRQELVCRNFSIDYNLGVEALKGPGGSYQYQDIVGAVRTGNESCSINFTVDSSAAGTVTLADWGRSTTNRFVMYTLSTADGSAVGFKFPKVCSTSVPVQIADGPANRVRFDGMCHTSDTLTSDLSRARMVLGFG
jgi:hypothetical protein